MSTSSGTGKIVKSSSITPTQRTLIIVAAIVLSTIGVISLSVLGIVVFVLVNRNTPTRMIGGIKTSSLPIKKS